MRVESNGRAMKWDNGTRPKGAGNTRRPLTTSTLSKQGKWLMTQLIRTHSSNDRLTRGEVR